MLAMAEGTEKNPNAKNAANPGRIFRIWVGGERGRRKECPIMKNTAILAVFLVLRITKVTKEPKREECGQSGRIFRVWEGEKVREGGSHRGFRASSWRTQT